MEAAVCDGYLTLEQSISLWCKEAVGEEGTAWQRPQRTWGVTDTSHIQCGRGTRALLTAVTLQQGLSKSTQ